MQDRFTVPQRGFAHLQDRFTVPQRGFVHLQDRFTVPHIGFRVQSHSFMAPDHFDSTLVRLKQVIGIRSKLAKLFQFYISTIKTLSLLRRMYLLGQISILH